MQPTSIEAVMEKESRYLLGAYGRYPLVIDSASGCHVFGIQGKRYLDAITGIGVNALGYGHPRIAAVLADQAARCIHTSNLVYHRYQGELAERLSAISGLDRAFFSNSGAEAMECALKAVRAHGRSVSPSKTNLVALDDSFHGRTFGALAITGQPGYRKPFEPLAPQVTFVAPNDEDDLARAVTKDTAGIVVEPVLGEGGIHPLTDSFLRRTRELADKHNALLIADETQCGLGRTGRYFGFQWSGIRPDLVVLAKPLAAGLPLGATLFTERAAGAIPPGKHGTTFGGGPLACRVAIEFLSVLDELLPNIAEVAEHLRAGLYGLMRRHSVITQIRSKGLMFGVQLSEPGLPALLRALDNGLLLNCTHSTVLRLLPPFVLSPTQAGEIVRILDKSLISDE